MRRRKIKFSKPKKKDDINPGLEAVIGKKKCKKIKSTIKNCKK